MTELNHSGLTNKQRDKNVEFWNRKGVIKMDPNCEERCSHMNIPPSTMMTLAMELSISNRGKASKMFRRGREGTHTPEENDCSKLANIWVVPGAGRSSRGQSPSTASHLKPSLANSDFVVQPLAPTTLVPEQSNVITGVLNAEDITKTFSVADLVGSQDHVIFYSDSESECLKSDKKRRNKNNSKSSQQKELVVDLGTNCEDNKKLQYTSPPSHKNIKKDIANKSLTECNNLSEQNKVDSIRCVTQKRVGNSEKNNIAKSELPSHNVKNQQSTNGQDIIEDRNYSDVVLEYSKHILNNDNFHEQLIPEFSNQLSKEIIPDKDTLKTERKIIFPDQIRVRASNGARVRSKSLQNENKTRTNTSEYGSNPCSTSPLPTSSVLSSSLSSSLFSLSSLGSSTSLPVSSITSEVQSMASCASISPDSDFGNVNITKRGLMHRHRDETVESKSDYSNTKYSNNNIEPKGSSDIAALPRPLNRNSGCAVGEVLTSLNSFGVGHERSPCDSNSNLTSKHVSKKTKIYSRILTSSPTRCPSRKVIHAYTEVLPEKGQNKLEGNVVSRAVFPDKDNSTQATPTLHLQVLSKSKSLNGLNSLDTEMLCCFKKSPKAPARKESKEATKRFQIDKRKTYMKQKNNTVIDDIAAQGKTNEKYKTDSSEQSISTRCHSRGCTVSLLKVSPKKQRDVKVKLSIKEPEKEIIFSKQSQEQESLIIPDNFSLLDEVIQQINDIHPRVRVVNGSKISLLCQRFPTSFDNYTEPNRPRENVAIFNQNSLNNRHARVIETIASQSNQIPTQGGNWESNSSQHSTNSALENTPIKCSSQNTNGHLKVVPKKIDSDATSNLDRSCIGGNSNKPKSEETQEQGVVALYNPVKVKPLPVLKNESEIKDLKSSNTPTIQPKTNENIEKQQQNCEIVQRSDYHTSNMVTQGSKFSSRMQVSLRTPIPNQRQAHIRVNKTQSAEPTVKNLKSSKVHPGYRKWVNEWSSSTDSLNPVTIKNFQTNFDDINRLDIATNNANKQRFKCIRSAESSPSLKYGTNVHEIRSKSSEPNEGNEKGQSRNQVLRKERKVRFLPKMVGNEIETVKPLNSVSNNNHEYEEGGVIEPPSMTVKDIRAMFHGGADYKNYAKPRSLSSSSGGSKQINRSKNPSECSSSENVDESKTKVAQQVMNMFQGALDLEKDLSVFQDENANIKAQNVANANNNFQKEAPTPPPKPPVNRKPKKLGNGVWPPPKEQQTFEENNTVPTSPVHVKLTPAPEEDINISVNKIKNETLDVASFDESLDQFYDVLNDLTS